MPYECKTLLVKTTLIIGALLDEERKILLIVFQVQQSFDEVIEVIGEGVDNRHD